MRLISCLKIIKLFEHAGMITQELFLWRLGIYKPSFHRFAGFIWNRMLIGK